MAAWLLHPLDPSENVFRAPGILDYPVYIILEWKPEMCVKRKPNQTKPKYTSRCTNNYQYDHPNCWPCLTTGDFSGHWCAACSSTSRTCKFNLKSRQSCSELLHTPKYQSELLSCQPAGQWPHKHNVMASQVILLQLPPRLCMHVNP